VSGTPRDEWLVAFSILGAHPLVEASVELGPGESKGVGQEHLGVQPGFFEACVFQQIRCLSQSYLELHLTGLLER
jgi:hypothetical protein